VISGAAAKTLLVLDDETVEPAFAAVLPIGAVEYLTANPPPLNLFNSYNWGGYLIYALPDVPVFIDGRTDLYGDVFVTDAYYRPAIGDESWRAVFTQYGINAALIEVGSGLEAVLRTEPGWRLAYADDLAAVFVRETPIAAAEAGS